MGLTNHPNGLTSFGIPMVGNGVRIPTSTGSYFFVHSGTGLSSYDGESPERPLATIDQAVNKCTADVGDVIIVMAGHAETIASATSLVVDIAGISIVGLGNGRNRPVLSFSATASRIPVSANDVFISNLVFLGAVADIVSGVTITGDDVTLQSCDFEVGSATLEFLQMLDIDAATRVLIDGCRFIANATAGTNNAMRIDACVDTKVRNCEFRGDYTTAAISGNAGSAAASTNISISNNLIENLDATAGLLIDMNDTTTGIIVRNDGFTAYTTNITAPFDTGACRSSENYVNNLVDETAGISPATASA